VQRRAAHGVLGRLSLDEVRRLLLLGCLREALGLWPRSHAIRPLAAANTFAEGAAPGAARGRDVATDVGCVLARARCCAPFCAAGASKETLLSATRPSAPAVRARRLGTVARVALLEAPLREAGRHSAAFRPSGRRRLRSRPRAAARPRRLPAARRNPPTMQVSQQAVGGVSARCAAGGRVAGPAAAPLRPQQVRPARQGARSRQNPAQAACRDRRRAGCPPQRATRRARAAVSRVARAG